MDDLLRSAPVILKKEKKKYSCAHCNKTFTNKSNKYRHQKYRCKNHKNEYVKDKYGKDKYVKNNYVKGLLDEQNAMTQKIDELTEIIKTNTITNPIAINQSMTIATQQNFNIYITEKVDFVKLLTEQFGEEEKAVNHIKKRMYQDDGNGDVELFSDIYLNGPKETWSIVCLDKKNLLFQYRDDNNNIITDPGGVMLHKRFKSNYTDTLLRMMDKELRKVIDYKVGTDAFEGRRDHLLDDFDIGRVQNKMYTLFSSNPRVFIKKLVDIMSYKEKIYLK